MAASIRTYISIGNPEERFNVDNGAGGVAIKFNRHDSIISTFPVPDPATANSTSYSWYKSLYLYCDSATGAGTTVSNRRIAYNGTLPSGCALVFKAGGATYVQATDGNRPTDVTTGTPPSIPTGWTQMTTTLQLYDSASVVTAGNTQNGQYVLVVLAVGTTASGGFSSTALPTIQLSYDEA